MGGGGGKDENHAQAQSAVLFRAKGRPVPTGAGRGQGAEARPARGEDRSKGNPRESNEDSEQIGCQPLEACPLPLRYRGAANAYFRYV